MLLLFRSEESLEGWCGRRGQLAGTVLTLKRPCELSRRWHGERRDPSFRGRSPDAARAIIRSVGLTGQF